MVWIPEKNEKELAAAEQRIQELEAENAVKDKRLTQLEKLAHKYPNGATGCCCLFDDNERQIVTCSIHATLKAENAMLKAWQQSAIEVENTWDCQKVGKEIEVPLGNGIREAILPYIISVKQQLAELRNENARLKAELATSQANATGKGDK